MGARIGKVVFSDWKSLPFQGGWTDTFIFRMSALACLPPWDYASLIRRMAAPVRKLRRSASIWVQVDAPGKWYAAEVRTALKGLALPMAVTGKDELDWLDFSYRPWLGVAPCPPPPITGDDQCPVSEESLLCLQALGRMKKGLDDEIASLAGFSVPVTQVLLADLQKRRLAVFKIGRKILRDKSRPAPRDPFPSWHLRRPGLSLALRRWGVPRNLSFDEREEENLYQICSRHRRVARLWPAWLKAAWLQAEIWTGWSEVQIPRLSAVPDALAWGRVQGQETLFWLEVGENHKKGDDIAGDVGKRLRQAIQLASRTGVRLVFAVLAPPWVRQQARWACTRLPANVAVAMGDWRRFGELTAP